MKFETLATQGFIDLKKQNHAVGIVSIQNWRLDKILP